MKNKGTKIYRGEIKPVALDNALRRSLGLIYHPSATHWHKLNYTRLYLHMMKLHALCGIAE